MTKDTRSVGLAFLLSTLLVAGAATAAHLLAGSISPAMAQSVCHQAYTLACIF